MLIHLETPRLLLRRFTEADAADLFALDSDAEVIRYIGPRQVADVQASRRLISERFVPYYAKNPGYGFWAAQARPSGDFLGWFHLRPALDYRYAREAGYQAGEVDLGYRLRRAAWGQGYATEGSLALVAKAFTEERPAAVVSCALLANVASTRVMEKVGLKRLGLFSLPGYEMPSVKYALLRTEWNS
jgi:RimJ/RimL family protein N-acetyltransferase